MRIPIVCHTCMAENGILGGFRTSISINDALFFKSSCPAGHEITSILQQTKYEVLFELGMNALIDGYTREAVTAFTSSLEGFYEFCVKNILISSELEAKSIDTMWEEIKNQSERQYGAFLGLWVKQFDTMPQILSNKNRSFRNKVVHKGFIPELSESIDFGKVVSSHIQENLRTIKNNLDKDLDKIFITEFLKRANANLDGNEIEMSTVCLPTTLDRWNIIPDGKIIDIEKNLERIRKNRKVW